METRYPDVDGLGTMELSKREGKGRPNRWHYVLDTERLCLFCSDWTAKTARPAGTYGHTTHEKIDDAMVINKLVELDKHNQCPRCERKFSDKVIDLVSENLRPLGSKTKPETTADPAPTSSQEQTPCLA